ncbi:acetate--CoA ligase family protein [Thermodesulfobacteriota bacterium]
MNTPDLERLFNPRHVALIGASTVPGKWGFSFLFNILRGDYKGVCYPVNPREKKILGIPCYQTVFDIPGPVDAALITTPAHRVPEIIEQCGKKGVHNVIIVSSGFSETGPEGDNLEKEVVARAERYGIRIVGPNTMGLFSAQSNFNGIMSTIEPLHGAVSMFSQSGNFGNQMLVWGMEEGLGFDKYVSSGNEGNLTCIDFLRYFGRDNATHIVVGYLEGVNLGSEFLSVVKEISREKPIIIYKGGRTERGSQAAASHTGAMTGAWKIYESAFRQTGVIQASTAKEVVDCAKAFSAFPLPKGNRIAILTRGGGWGVITTDVCQENGLEVPPLSDGIRKKISKILPEYWSEDNPVDLVGVTNLEPFLECLEILAYWDGADAVIALGGRVGPIYIFNDNEAFLERVQLTSDSFSKMAAESSSEDVKMASMAGELMKATGKPITFVDITPREAQLKSIRELRTISFPTPEKVVKVLKRMYDYRQYLESLP